MNTSLLTPTALALALTGCVSQRGFPPEHQIVNFDKVDSQIYRGAQPTVNGFEFLRTLGVKSVVSLRLAKDVLPDEKEAVEQLGLTFTNLPMSGMAPPTVAEMNRMLDAIERLPQPVFIHCQFGCDRTGIVVACWRIRQSKWPRAKALREAKAYGISPLLVGMRSFVLNFKGN